MIQRSPAILIVGTLALASVARAAFPPEQIDFFEKSIRPLLAEHCYDCHSASKHENGLRLDNQADALRGSDYGKVIEPGSPAASKLIKAVKHMDGVEPMPKKGAALKPEDIALLEKWITLGAPWPEEKALAQSAAKPKWQDHWSFQKITKPALPLAKGEAAPRNPIDAFVLAKLSATGLKPAPPADATTLCRRLYLNVTGLLPTFEQVEAFKQAYARAPSAAESALVDQLLSSPAYGERWGRYWLDIARYSDTEGYQVAGKDIRYPYAYTFRDWVVNSLNEDLPYDQFLTYQLAADKIVPVDSPEGSPALKNLAALGFLTVGDSFIGNNDLKTDDRIDVTARGMLGLTVGCARCHDHKYDPIPAKDYYAMYSIFNSSHEPEELPVIGKPPSDTAYASFKAEMGKVDVKMADFRKVVYDDMRNPERLRDYLAFVNEAQVKKLVKEAYRGRVGQLKLRDRVAFKWTALVEESTLKGTPNPVMAAWKEFAALPEGEFAAKAAEVVQRLQTPDSHCNPEIVQAFKDKVPASFTDVATVYADVFLKHLSPVGAKDDINALLMRPTSPMAYKVDDMEQFFTRQDMETTVRMKNEMKKIEITNPGAPPRAMVMVDRPKPADMHVFIRGNPGRPGALAPRANLTLLGGQAFTDGSGRLELARSITSRDNPLTARVLVNRVWMNHFGKPLVSTPSDFGMQAPPPEQAALLDYLAATFMEQGWSLKKLHHLILTSTTYQQSCQTTPEKDTKDAENYLLSRFNRTRLDYEAMHDAVVKVSGLLNIGAMGGRSIPLTTPDVDSRRTLYQFVDRYDQATVPATFDFANPDSHSPQRFVTTVPQQALFLMNSPFMKQQAEMLAKKLPKEPTAAVDSEAIKTLYHRVLLREPKPDEVELAERFVNDAQTLQGTPPFLWKYGTARMTRIGDKTELTEWQPFEFLDLARKKNTWSHTGTVPDKKWGFAMITEGGGHAPNADLVVSRRWQAPADLTIVVRGTLKRPATHGNGVRGLVILNNTKLLQEALADPAKPSQLMALAGPLTVKKGDILDFAVSAENGETDSDSFEWTPEIQLPATNGKPEVLTNAKADFCGKDGWPLNRDKPQSALSQLVQVLMMSNEFMFVD